jgi:protein-S-isoprenylcysteine O-methyltransferase Ste14
LGISYDDKEINRVASILYGAGGGLIVDEVGLLLTFDNYWTSLTYSFLIIFLAFIIVLMFFFRYRSAILEEIAEFAISKVSLYLGIFLVAVSVGFIIQTDNFLVIVLASIIIIMSVILVLVFLIQELKINPEEPHLNREFLIAYKSIFCCLLAIRIRAMEQRILVEKKFRTKVKNGSF